VQLGADNARRRFAAARVARLATSTPSGAPHLVPIVFAVVGDMIYTAVDGKPKRSTQLQRLRNVAAEPRVAVLADGYDEDWTRPWWTRADGAARIAADDEAASALDALREKYPQYAAQPPPGPVLAIDVARWSGWAAVADQPEGDSSS
jgi:PPOX class probable F420-dependent enzyme